jgi:hypothetical protein
MKKLLIILLFCISGATHAMAIVFPPPQDRGEWLCNDCLQGSLNTGGDIKEDTVAGPLMAFLKHEINPTVKRWVPDDTVTVCNGAECVTLLYLANGNFIVKKARHPDKNNGTYKNSKKEVVTYDYEPHGGPYYDGDANGGRGACYLRTATFHFYWRTTACSAGTCQVTETYIGSAQETDFSGDCAL